MAPTPPHTPPLAFGATGSRRRPSTRPPQRPRWHRPPKRFATLAGRRGAHPIALILAACCTVSLTLLTACAKDAPPTEVSGTLPTRFFSTPDASADALATPIASALPSLSPELAAQREAALAEPKPSKPEVASQNTEEGAVEAAFYFLQLYRYAFIAGDTTDFAAMSEEGCVFCKSTIDDATTLHEGGGWANPWDQEAPNVTYIPAGEGKEYCGVKMTIESGESTSVDSSGQVQHSDARDDTQLFIALRYYDGGWHVGQVSVLDS